MKLPSIEGYRPLNNRVLVRIDSRYTDIIKIKSGFDVVNLKIDTSYEPEKHTITKGVVVAVPDKLTFGPHNHEMDWDTDMEVSVGDDVYFSWEAVAFAFGKQGLVIEVEGQDFVYVNIRYAQLTLKVSKDFAQDISKDLAKDIVMLNGYCLIEELATKDLPTSLTKNELRSDIISILPTSVSKKSAKYGRVLCVGSANREYENPVYSDDILVKEGDLVCYAGFSNVSVQYEMHADLIDKKNLFKIQRRFLFAILN